MSNIIPALIGLVGTLIGAAIAWFASRRQFKLKAAWDLHREFNDPDMLTARTKADQCLKQIPKGETLRDVYNEEGGSECFMAAWKIMSLYQRIWIAIKHKQLSHKLAVTLFGEVFIWWYIVYFRDKVVPVDDWLVARDLENFWEWLYQRRSDMEDFDVWLEVARADRENISNDAG